MIIRGLTFGVLLARWSYADPPNIVLFLADDLGYADVGYTMQYALQQVHGARWKKEIIPETITPNIDALASSGVTFTDGYVSGSVCSPTRAGLMIGRYQQRVGIYNAGDGGNGMEILDEGKTGFRGNPSYRPINPFIPDFLNQKEKSYVSGVFGKWHLGLDKNYVVRDDGSLEQEEKRTTDTTYTDPPEDLRSTKATTLLPMNGPIVQRNGLPVTSGVPDELILGSPYHALNRGFDNTFFFMGRGSTDFWDPNDLYISTDKMPTISKVYRENRRRNPGYGDSDDDIEVPTDAWDSSAKSYKINAERTPKNYLTNRLVDEAISFIETNAKDSKPFFAYVPFNAPHSPAQAPYHMESDGVLNNFSSGARRYAGMGKTKFKSTYLQKDPDPTDDNEVNIEVAWLKGKDLAKTFNNEALDGWFPDPLFIYQMYKDDTNGLNDFHGGNPERDEDRRRRSITVSMVRWLDRGVGRVVQALKENKVYENTVILFLSDNGGAPMMHASNKPLQSGKGTTFEGGSRVPFLFSWDRYLKDVNGKDRRGTKISAPVTALDILPTLLEINSLDPIKADTMLKTPGKYDYNPDGESLLSLIDDPKEASLNRVYLFWAQNLRKSSICEGAVRKGHWKLRVVVPEKDSGDATYELYDLDSDLAEARNIADSNPGVTGDLKNAYRIWMNRVAKSNFEKTPNVRLSNDLRFVLNDDDSVQL